MEKIKIEPCPICGSDPVRDTLYPMIRLMCYGCKCRVIACSEDDVINAWNNFASHYGEEETT